jgi:type II restriction enzyme
MDMAQNGVNWTQDVRDVVSRLSGKRFKLADVYRGNQNVKAKIRQQLQILRDLGEIEFVSPGVYKKNA